jgi:hypothetical protein
VAIAPDGALVLIELKRNRTPREVVAQALDYATWLEKLKAEDIFEIYKRFKPGRDLKSDLHARFGHGIEDDGLNQTHQIIIVAASLDDSTERIITYLNERDIAINVLCFQVFADGADQLLTRAWLLDPVRTQINAAAPPNEVKEPWNGEFYANFGGDGDTRSWKEAVQYGFISGRGGPFYTNTLKLLNPSDRVWAKAPGNGFVGVGRVTGTSQPASSFQVGTSSGKSPALDVLKGGTYHREFANAPDRCEYFVPIKWLDTVTLEKAVNEIGLFGNQNTVCKPTTPKWRSTVERLKQHFPQFQLADHLTVDLGRTQSSRAWGEIGFGQVGQPNSFATQSATSGHANLQLESTHEHSFALGLNIKRTAGCSFDRVQHRPAVLVAVENLEIAVQQDLVKRKCRQCTHGQHGGGAGPTATHHECKRHVGADTQAGDAGMTGKGGSVAVHCGVFDGPDHVHHVDGELSALRSGPRLRRKGHTIE